MSFRQIFFGLLVFIGGIVFNRNQVGLNNPSSSPPIGGGNPISAASPGKLGKCFISLHFGGIALFLSLSQLVRTGIYPLSKPILPERILVLLALLAVFVAFKGVKLLAANCEEVKLKDHQLPIILHASFISAAVCGGFLITYYFERHGGHINLYPILPLIGFGYSYVTSGRYADRYDTILAEIESQKPHLTHKI